MKVLYAASEAVPFIASGGLADVAGSLPAALRKRLIGCRVVIPFYDRVPEELRASMKLITSFSVPVSWRRQYCGVFEARHNGVIYYLLDNQYYFKRDEIYGHYDDAERFAFFSRAVIELLNHIDFQPDIIHANDWQCALVPIYHHLFYRNTEKFSAVKTIFTIHNIQYQGKYGYEILGDVFGIPPEAAPLVDHDGCVNLMKGAIETADKVTTVSPTYASEILDPWFSHGLDSILKPRKFKLSGILNGIDTALYSAETDVMIYQNFSLEDLTGKAVNKQKLQERLKLPVREDVPIIAMVTRLVSHKGLDLVNMVLDSLLEQDIQFILLGSGEWSYENAFKQIQSRHPDKMSFSTGFVPELAHKIYAAADIFLMPSKSEPCGLSQMVSCRYGTVPVVRETGGLKDSIQDCGDGEGMGFTFKTYHASDMLDAINRAVGAYNSKKHWDVLVERCLNADFSWGKSANQYIRLYNEVVKSS